MEKTVECGDSLSVDDVAGIPETMPDLPLVLIAPNEGIAAIWRKQYPGIDVIVQKRLRY